jgi:hypothetical protein
MKPVFLDYNNKGRIADFGLSDHELERLFSDVHPFEPKWIEVTGFWDKLLEKIERADDNKGKAFPPKAQWIVSFILKSSIDFGKEMQGLDHKKQNTRWIWEGNSSELTTWSSEIFNHKEATQKAYSILNPLMGEFCAQFKASLNILSIYCLHIQEQKLYWFTVRQPHGKFELLQNHKISSCKSNDILNMLSLYREAINSNSPFYQLLCFYKICYETSKVFSKLKSEVESQNINVTLIKPDIPSGKYKGKNFDEFLQKSDAHNYRTKVSHWLTNKGAQVNFNSFNELVRYWESNAVLNFIARTTIINCLKLWQAINKPNEQFGIDPRAKVSTDFSWTQNETATPLPEEILQTKPFESIFGPIPSESDRLKILAVVPFWGRTPIRGSLKLEVEKIENEIGKPVVFSPIKAHQNAKWIVHFPIIMSFVPIDVVSEKNVMFPINATPSCWSFDKDKSKSMLTIPIKKAKDYFMAVEEAYKKATNVLNQWSLYLGTKIYLCPPATFDNNEKKIYMDYYKYAEGEFNAEQIPTGSIKDPKLSQYLAVYKEAINTNSPFYRFLCLWKLVEGYADVLQNMKEKKDDLQIKLKKDPDISIKDKGEGQKRIKAKQYLKGIARPKYRNVIAHFDPKAKFSFPDSYEGMMVIYDEMPRMHSIVQVRINNLLRIYFYLNPSTGKMVDN